MSKKITKEVKALIKDSKELAIYELSNNHLYELFTKYPKHVNAKGIVAKVLILGRTYAAAIERGRGSKGAMTNDEFYTNEVPTAFKGLRLDQKLQAITKMQTLEKSTESCLKAHWVLMKGIKDITGKDKRSFCSKYLHFHSPENFFLYDFTSLRGLKNLSYFLTEIEGSVNTFPIYKGNWDMQYFNFYQSCVQTKSKIEKVLGKELTYREFDALIITAGKKNGIASDLKLAA